MPNNLVIVESPAKSKTISGYLGEDYNVLATIGHIRDLPSRQGSIDPDNDFNMIFEVGEGSRKQVKKIKPKSYSSNFDMNRKEPWTH